MPDYPFRCPNCGIEVNLNRSVHEDVHAPRCDCGQMMARIYEATPTVFKGSGFYKTDKGIK